MAWKSLQATSGSLSPSLNTGIGMAYIPTEYARINEEIEVDIRGKLFSSEDPEKTTVQKIMSDVLQDLKYAESHEWLRIRG